MTHKCGRCNSEKLDFSGFRVFGDKEYQCSECGFIDWT